MSPEELEEVKARMAELRQLATAKKQAMASEKKAVKEELQAVREKELNLKKELVKRKKLEVAGLEYDVATTGTDDESEDDAPPVAPPRRRKAVATPSAPDPMGFLQMYQMVNSMKQEIKNKYRSKYGNTSQPKPMAEPPPVNVVAGTAKDVLKSRVDDEIRQMAHKALFGGW